MLALLAPHLQPASSSSNNAEGKTCAPAPACSALVWRALELSEAVRLSAASSGTRRDAPAAVRLALGARRLRLATSVAAGQDAASAAALSALVELTLALEAGRAVWWQRLVEVARACRSLLRTTSGGGSSDNAQLHLACVNALARLLGAVGLAGAFEVFDCSASDSAMLEPVVEALASAARSSALRQAALETLVAVAKGIVVGARETCLGNAADASRDATPPAGWAEVQRQRSALQEEVALFNRKPEEWWRGCSNADAAARFLASNLRPRGALRGDRVGDFLGSNAEVLAAFLHSFNLSGLGIVQALARVLRGLQMPGEAQQVDRFVQHFGTCWGTANGVDAEIAYIVAFSVVMLSTDLNAPARSGHERMTLPEFERSLAGALPAGLDSLPAGSTAEEIYAQVQAGALVGAQHSEEGPGEVCAALELALLAEGSGCCCASAAKIAAAAAVVTGAAAKGAENPAAQRRLASLGLWRALWSVCWGPLLGAFSAGAHAAAEESEELEELALRGLQLGCEAAALLEEIVQAEAFSTALRHLSP
eukprot:TRINITY_DN16910_c0_g1_i1.p1 TRINITY_DN16910_c0_g1~~TRINITY_DN16910_c0_g1_i1.p1  ORF type:complete len:539 (+),score=125.13 TRINITY_DN16910_c0_g1_i1:71-1687(+)